MIEFEKNQKDVDFYEKERRGDDTISLMDHGDERSFEVIESLGKYLRAERENRCLSLEEAAKFTKIREHFLRAIEEDRYELLPHTIYVKGFLAHYARYLGLDPKAVVHRYEKYQKSVVVEPPEAKKEIRPLRRGIKPRLLYFFYIFIFAVILLIPLLIYQVPRQFKEGRTSILQRQESALVPHLSLPSSLPVREKVETPKQGSLARESFSFEVVEAKMGTSIEWEGARVTLRGMGSEIFTINQKPYFFTRIKTQKEGKITHVWLWEGKEFFRKDVEVKPPAWSVYTCITLSPHFLGEWKVEARDGDHVLASLNFKATEPTQPSQ